MRKSILLRIRDHTSGDHVVELAADDRSPGWRTRVLVSERVPHIDRHPERPELDGQPADAAKIRELFLGASDPRPEVKAIGEFLGRLLLPEAIRDELHRQNEGNRVRILLEVGPPELRRLPWELVRLTDRIPLFLAENTPWSRISDVEPEGSSAGADHWPLLRVLLVMGVDAGAGASDEIGARNELQIVKDELARYAGFVDIEVLDRPLVKDFRNRFRLFRPHLLHFIGHGTTGAGGGGLRIDRKGDQAGDIWTAEKIAIDLQGWTPRLVFINACRSAEISAQDGSWEVIDAFVRDGVRAVIGMQGDVSGDAAAVFAGALYKALGDDEPVDVAVMRGRTAITDQTDLTSHHPWIPSLTVTTTAQVIFPQRYALGREDSERILGHVGFERIGAFVDRKEQRRELWSALHGDERAPKVIGVQGSDGDQSAFVKWCVGSMALVGRNTAFVDLTAGEHRDVLQFLGAIADELASFPSQRSSNQAAFDEWLAAVDEMQRPAAPPPRPARAPGERRYERQLQEGPETAALNVLGAFSAALRRAAGDELIILAVTGLTKIESGAWSNYVLPELVAPIIAGQLPVQLILATREGGLQELMATRPRLLNEIQHVRIGPVPEEQTPELIVEYLLASGRRREKFQSIVNAMKPGDLATRDDELFRVIESLARLLSWEEE